MARLRRVNEMEPVPLGEEPAGDRDQPVMKGVLASVARLSRPQVVALAFAGVAIIGAIDYVTGIELGVSLFYLGPVALIAWRVGAREGYAFAALSAATWLAADLAAGHVYSHQAISIWNATIRLGFFAIVAGLVDALRVRLEIEGSLARTDTLTGVLNRRAFIEQLEFAIGLASRDGQPFGVVYVDLDDFKKVNDVHGHSEGDRVLRTVARTCAESVRRTDVVARLGGDEFALLLRGSDRAGAEGVITKARRTLAAAFRSQRAGVTCSIGAIIFQGAPRSVEEAIEAADALMYEVKKQGKDSVALRTIDAAPEAAPSGG